MTGLPGGVAFRQPAVREFKGQGLEVLLVNFRECATSCKRTAQERGYTAPVLLDESGDVTGRVYGVWGPPTVYLVDRAGPARRPHPGPRDWSTPAARNLLRSLVEETSP